MFYYAFVDYTDLDSFHGGGIGSRGFPVPEFFFFYRADWDDEIGSQAHLRKLRDQ